MCTRGRGFLSRARTHGSLHSACAIRSRLAEGKCLFACVLIIVPGRDTHRGILPPCKLILRYYQFTSATLEEKMSQACESEREGCKQNKISTTVFEKEELKKKTLCTQVCADTHRHTVQFVSQNLVLM